MALSGSSHGDTSRRERFGPVTAVSPGGAADAGLGVWSPDLRRSRPVLLARLPASLIPSRSSNNANCCHAYLHILTHDVCRAVRYHYTALMPYRFLPVEELPYPHAMADRGSPSCPYSLNELRSRFNKGSDWYPTDQLYAQLYDDPDIREEAKSCRTHRGSWASVVTALKAFLADFPQTADAQAISNALTQSSYFRALSREDQHLAKALLHPRDPIRVSQHPVSHTYSAVGQHRICAARCANSFPIPVWVDESTPSRYRSDS